ncbi:MAG: hypothetical protein ACRENU_12505 [Gemmatimonadaceae bacterium]
MRRLVALALGTFMLHLNVERADFACGTHSDAATESRSEQAAAAHHDHSASETSPAEKEPCRTPTQVECCQALVSCSGFTDLSAIGELPLTTHRDGTIALAQREPSSLVRAPDPPPPRV